MKFLSKFFNDNENVVHQEGSNNLYIKNVLQNVVTAALIGTIALGALAPTVAQANNLETKQMYSLSFQHKEQIENHVRDVYNKNNITNVHVKKALRESQEIQAQKKELENAIHVAYEAVINGAKDLNLFPKDLKADLDLMIQHELKPKTAVTDHLTAYSNWKDMRVEFEYNPMGSITTVQNLKDLHGGESIQVSNEAMFEIVALHEAAHNMHASMGGFFKSDKLTHEQNQEINDALMKMVDNIEKNSASMSSDAQGIHYLSTLQESYADMVATIAYLKMHNFSEKSIQDVKDFKDVRVKNSLNEIEAQKENSNGGVIIDPYATDGAIDYVLNNLDKIKDMDNSSVKDFALNFSSNSLVNLAMLNKGKSFDDKDVELINRDVQDLIEKTGVNHVASAEVATTNHIRNKEHVMNKINSMRSEITQSNFKFNF